MDRKDQDMNLFGFILLCCDAVRRLFVWLLGVLLQTIRLGLQYFWIVLICTVMGGFAGWVLSRPSLTRFNGQATIYVTEGMKPAVIEGINLFFLTSDTARFQLCGIPRHSVEAARKIEFFNIVDAKCDSVPDYVDTRYSASTVDTMRCIMSDRFNLSFGMNGEADFYPYMNALSVFLNNQPHIEQADKKLKAIARQKLGYLNSEVARLDSLASCDYFEKHSGCALVNSGLPAVVAERGQHVYTAELLALKRHRDYVRQQIDQTPDIINFQTPFIVTRIPSWRFYLWGIILGCGSGLLVALSVKYRKQVFDYLKKK